MRTKADIYKLFKTQELLDKIEVKRKFLKKLEDNIIDDSGCLNKNQFRSHVRIYRDIIKGEIFTHEDKDYINGTHKDLPEILHKI